MCVRVILVDLREYNTSDNSKHISTPMETAADIQQKNMWHFSKTIFIHQIQQCKASAGDTIFKFASFQLMLAKRLIFKLFNLSLINLAISTSSKRTLLMSYLKFCGVLDQNRGQLHFHHLIANTPLPSNTFDDVKASHKH